MTTHELRWRFPVPGAFADGDDWVVQWDGAALMGVVNVTPDSFSDGGDFVTVTDAIAHARELKYQGALVIDVGGESTRPGAEPLAAAVEMARIVPVIAALADDADVLISVDTRHAEVAAAALDAGAHIVNDVSGLRDDAMVSVCARAGVPAIVMHMQGDPVTMQVWPVYENVVIEVGNYLGQAARHALANGVPSVMIDPGLGFGKTVDHNLELLAAGGSLGPFPVLIGASRKRFIGTLTNTPEPKDRLEGTLAAHMVAAQRGAAMLRVHDVAAHRKILVIHEALAQRGGSPLNGIV